MENGTGNPEPSWQQSAYTCASAAAEPGLCNQGWAAAHSNNHACALDISSYTSQSIEDSYAASTAYNNGIALSTAPNPYTWGPAAPTAYSNNDAFAPFVTSSHLPFTGNSFAAGIAYNDGTTFPSAFTPHTWDAAAPTGSMANSIGAGLQYPDPSFPVMNPFGAGTNGMGDGYQGHYHQGQFPAPSFDVQPGPAVQAPTASHVAAPLAVAPSTAQRPTCSTCGQTFSRKADLERHARVHRPGSKVHRCPHAGCGYSSTRKDKLNEHARRPH